MSNEENQQAEATEAATNGFDCPECGKQCKNRLSLGMHKVRMHSDRGKTWRNPGEAGGAFSKGARPDRKPRKKYTRRKPTPVPVAHTTSHAVAFCPRCGCNLRAVTVAMGIVQ